MSDAIIGYECRHATYCVDRFKQNDLLVIKEYLYKENGERVPNLRMVKNYKQSFWITRENFRKHRDKIEWEEEVNLKEYKSTRVGLPKAIAAAINYRGGNMSLKHINRCPYVYGCDIETTSLIKKEYKDRYPQCVHPSASVAVLDIETNMDLDARLNMVSLTMKDRVAICIVESFLTGVKNPVNAIHEKFIELLGDIANTRKIKLEIFIEPSPGSACAKIISKAHEWKPDIVTIWNINFDLPKMIRELKDEHYDLGDVFSDPSVPRDFRFFDYVEGPSKKRIQDGTEISIHPADRWHVATCPASFYFIDAMCLYKRIRTAGGNEPSYGLDAIMNKHIQRGKLKFDSCDHLSAGDWHREMQKNHKVEYCVYNIWDCIGLEMLDEKTGDIRSAFSVLAGVSDFANFSRNPRRIADDLHYFCRERGLVMATVPDDLKEEHDQHVIGMDDWIVTLPSYLIADNGIPLIDELPSRRSQMRYHNADLDIEGTYPTIECVLNISKKTTQRELGAIQGISEKKRREIGINLSGGVSNAIEIGVVAFGLPTSLTLLEAFEKTL